MVHPSSNKFIILVDNSLLVRHLWFDVAATAAGAGGIGQGSMGSSSIPAEMDYSEYGIFSDIFIYLNPYKN